MGKKTKEREKGTRIPCGGSTRRRRCCQLSQLPETHTGGVFCGQDSQGIGAVVGLSQHS